MKIIKGIEGDYIETKEDNLFFDVKGLLHPEDRKICFLRFYPHPEGDRAIKGIKFKKVYNLEERFYLLRNKYPKYIFFSEELDLEIQSVRNQDIKKVHSPREFLQNLKERENLSNVEKYSSRLCELFISRGGISQGSIGITGSAMVGLNRVDSDIDIVIYGTEIAHAFQEQLKVLLYNSTNLRKYNLKEYSSHYDWRVGGSNITFEDFIKSEQRKLHQGKFHGHDYFIRYIKSPEDWGGNYYDYNFTNLGRTRIKAFVTDSKDSLFTPCSYKIDNVTILKKNLVSNGTDLKDISEITSYRARFCEQAKEGEFIFVEGKLEGVYYKNEFTHNRIILTDQTKDKILIIK